MVVPVRPDGFIDYPRLVDPFVGRPEALAQTRPYAPLSGTWSVPQAIVLYEYVRAFAYIADPLGVSSFVQLPEVTLRERAGNCEARSLLLCCMLRSVGIPSRMMGIARGREAHLLVQVNIGQYPLHTLSQDLAHYNAPDPLQRKYQGIWNRQYCDIDASGSQWLYIDPVISSFAGDIYALSNEGYLRWTENGPTWPPSTLVVYFSDGSDLQEQVA